MIRPVEDGLVMQQLLYAGEVRTMKDLDIPKTEVKPAELKLAQQLIEQQASDTFDPSQYKDDVAARIAGGGGEEGRGPGDHARRGARAGRASHRPHGSAARESREEGAGARDGQARAAAEPEPRSTRKPPKRAQPAEPAGAGRAQGSQEVSELRRPQPRPVHPYGVRDVEKLLRLPRSTIRALIAAGFVSPARGPRGAWLFSFQDLIVLRTAQALADAKVPPRRITRSVRELRRHLPDAMPLSGLSHRRGRRSRRRSGRRRAGRRSPDSTCSTSMAIRPTAR